MRVIRVIRVMRVIRVIRPAANLHVASQSLPTPLLDCACV